MRRTTTEREALIKLLGRIEALNDVADIIAAASETCGRQTGQNLPAGLAAMRKITMECAALSDATEEAFLDLAEQMFPGRSFAQH